MPGIIRLLLVAVASIGSGWLFETLVSSSLGQRLVASVGFSDLTTVAGLKSARTYLSASAGLAVNALIRGNTQEEDNNTAPDTPIGSLAELAEMMLAAGALLKLISDFVSDRRQTSTE